jgi:diguanylate cyclase (GGDEF)-like protein
VGVSEAERDDPQARLLFVSSQAWSAQALLGLAERTRVTGVHALWPLDLSRALADEEPDVLLLCMAKGETWGFEVCADLRVAQTAHDMPVVLLVPADEEGATERGLRAGADDVLRTGSSDGEVGARIAVQLRNKRHRDALRSLRSERDHLRHKASVDPLTQVLNRGALEEALQAELGRGGPFAVMFVDLDHFKSINDRFGHDVGDTVLRAVGGHLKRTIRSNDIAGRYGGEEFVVGLAGCDQAIAPKIAERHREWIEKLTFPKEGHPSSVTASIGLAVFNPDVPDSSLGALLKRADAAVYQAKRAGRNRVVFASALRRSIQEEASEEVAQRISRSTFPLCAELSRSEEAKALEAELVKQLNAGNAPLPAIPAVAMAALRLAQQPNVNISTLAKVVEQDPLITARFLAIGNSALYYRGFRTASTRDAVMRMGLSEARDVLSNIAYSASLPKYTDLLTESSERATIAAQAAVAVARELALGYEPAYLCGLLHNLGEARVLRILAGLPVPTEGLHVIGELVERYHAHAGAQLAEKWNLHSDIVQACALHHDEKHAESRPVRVAMLSDVFARVSTRGHPEPTNEEANGWRKLGITDPQAQTIIRAVRG